MTIRNNPIIGNVECQYCQAQATVHMVSRGNARRGMLYTKGCNCKPSTNQSTSENDQVYWLENTIPVENYSDLVPEGFEHVFDSPVGGRPEVAQVEETYPEETPNLSDNAASEVEDGEGSPGKVGLFMIGAGVLGALALVGLR